MKPTGVKRQIETVLGTVSVDKAITMSEIMTCGGIPKTSANDVSSALAKLRNAGKVGVLLGKASSKSGRKFVRRYFWMGECNPAPASAVQRVFVGGVM